MKIVVINGSHTGKAGNTNIMVNALLKGAQKAGAETINIILAEKQIKHCAACKACWFNTPGQCVIKDDMVEIISLMEGADIRILATPIYFDNISGMLKVFMDRMMVTASPYWGKDEAGECRHLTTKVSPQLIMMSNGGYPERSQFQVISHWIKRHARNLNTEIISEIYCPQGALLSTRADEVKPIVANYLQVLETAGKEIVANMKLTEETTKLLEQNFIPDEVYIQGVKGYVDGILKNSALYATH